MSQHSDIARSAIMSCASPPEPPREHHLAPPNGIPNGGKDANLMPPKTVVGRALGNELHPDAHKPLSAQPSRDGVGFALTDTPISTAPSSPQMYVAPPFPVPVSPDGPGRPPRFLLSCGDGVSRPVGTVGQPVARGCVHIIHCC